MTQEGVKEMKGYRLSSEMSKDWIRGKKAGEATGSKKNLGNEKVFHVSGAGA